MVPDRAPDSMISAASAFLAALDEGGRQQALLPFADPVRGRWSYLPGHRAGLRLGQMSSAQREAAHALMRSVLSQAGYTKASEVIRLEEILGALEGNPRSRDPALYTVTVFGAPAPEGAWSWRIEGHHLSLNFTAAAGEVVAVTPAFFGANPAEVPDGPKAGWRVLAAEEDLGREMLGLLEGRRRLHATLSGQAPRDIITGRDRKARLERFEGLPARDMTEEQRTALLRLLDVYVQNLRPELALEQFEKIRQAGVERLHFAWAGSAVRGQGHYYRIHGPTVLIEYDNTQNQANHIHTVWRDLTNDFGEDALRRHYEQGGHHGSGP